MTATLEAGTSPGGLTALGSERRQTPSRSPPRFGWKSSGLGARPPAGQRVPRLPRQGSHANAVTGKCLREREGRPRARDATDPVFASSETGRVVGRAAVVTVVRRPRLVAD